MQGMMLHRFTPRLSWSGEARQANAMFAALTAFPNVAPSDAGPTKSSTAYAGRQRDNVCY